MFVDISFRVGVGCLCSGIIPGLGMRYGGWGVADGNQEIVRALVYLSKPGRSRGLV